MTDEQDANATDSGADNTKTSTFLVTHAEDETAILSDVYDGQVHAVAESSTLAVDDVLDGTLAPEPPMETTWRLVDVEQRRTIPVERVDLEPTGQAIELAAEQAVGELTRRERAGDGEFHVITVPGDGADEAADDVVADRQTLARAARLGVDRVEVRTAEGVLSVRYLPD